MRNIALVISLLVLFAVAAWAADPPAPAPAPPADEPALPEDEFAFPSEQPQPAPRAAPPPATAPAAPAPAASPATAGAAEEAEDEVLPPLPPGSRNVGPTQQRFDPTEKVRADFPVSFPVDI